MSPKLPPPAGKPTEMSLGESLPISESLGVFLGVSGLDWLADGNAEILRAIAAGLATGIVLFTLRRRKRQR